PWKPVSRIQGWGNELASTLAPWRTGSPLRLPEVERRDPGGVPNVAAGSPNSTATGNLPAVLAARSALVMVSTPVGTAIGGAPGRCPRRVGDPRGVGGRHGRPRHRGEHRVDWGRGRTPRPIRGRTWEPGHAANLANLRPLVRGDSVVRGNTTPIKVLG